MKHLLLFNDLLLPVIESSLQVPGILSTLLQIVLSFLFKYEEVDVNIYCLETAVSNHYES